MNPKSLTSGNNNNNCGNQHHEPSSLGGNVDSELQRWFLSLVCLDSPVHAIATTRGRSAFSWYQRPTMESKESNNNTNHTASLIDTTVDEDEQENEDRDSNYDDNDDDTNNHDDDGDERDDVEIDFQHFSSIERTFSFDDWDDVDDYCPATSMSPTPHVFRFDDWSTVSKDSDTTGIATKMPPSPTKCKSFPHEPKSSNTEPCLDSLVTTRNQTPYHVQYHNEGIIRNESSSMMTMVPPSHSFLFQPIPDGSSSHLSVSLTAPPTLSFRSIDLLSLDDDEVEKITNNHDVTIPECPGIPRVASNDEEDDDDELYHPVVFSIHMDNRSPCISSPTNPEVNGHNPHRSMPPIPQVVFIPREPKGFRRTIQKSWNRIVSIRRRDTFRRNTKRRISTSGRRVLPRNGLRGEF